MKQFYIALLILSYGVGHFTIAADKILMPKGQQFALSLSYDDALASQLDKALPSLNRHKFRASFYVFMSAPVFSQRLEEWKALAEQGHELGNHTLYHVCSAGKPDRQWVKTFADLDTRSAEHMREEISLANTFLRALDGNTKRTFTIPCGDVMATDKNYVPEIADLFVAIKAQGLQDGSETLLMPKGESAEALIDFVRNTDPSVSVINILFHGIGGDHLSVSEQAHDGLLAFLSQHRDRYWVDSYVNIMSYVNEQKRSAKQSPEPFYKQPSTP